MKTPIIVVNLKAYAESTGKNALEIAKTAKEVAKESKASIAVCCQATDITLVSKKVKIPVMAQHIDPVEQGSRTGWLTAEAVKEAGAVGTLINHSEHRLPFEEIRKALERAKQNKLTTIICAKDDNEAEQLASLEPDFIAVEPPDLIGGDVSVTTRPELVKNSVERVKRKNPKVKVLVGAGVKTKEDVAKAIELKADGVLLASGVVKAADKRKVLKELAEGLRS